MSLITKTVIVSAPIAHVFEIVTTPKTVAALIPAGVRIPTPPRLPLRRGTSFKFEAQFLGLPIRGTWTVEDLASPNLYLSAMTGIPSRWVYTLVPRGRGTKLTLDIEYTPPTSLVRRYALGLIEPHADQVIETYLQSLKIYAETHSGEKR